MKTTGEQMNGVSGIYGVIHRATGACYVGSSVNLAVRRGAHLNTAKRGSPIRFHRALRELGADEFDFEVLERCEKAHLLERERFYIALLGAADIGGLNVRHDPAAVYGTVPTEATRKRQSAAKIGKPLSEEHKALLRSAPRRSKKPLSAEHRAKLSAAHKTSVKCLDHIARLHAAFAGKPQSQEHIEKKAAALRGRKQPAEVSARIAAANKGKTMSPEARANMSAGWVRWREKRDIQRGQTFLAV